MHSAHQHPNHRRAPPPKVHASNAMHARMAAPPGTHVRARVCVQVRDYIVSGADPTVVAVLMEDGGAVLGLGIAGICTALAHATGNFAYDAAGSVLVRPALPCPGLACVLACVLAWPVSWQALLRRGPPGLRASARRPVQSVCSH